MFRKKKVCSVCGYRFTPKKEEIYTAEEPRAFVEALTTPPTRFSATDCPRCGCQIPLAIRVPRVTIPEISEQEATEELKPFDYAEQATRKKSEVKET